MPSGCLCFTAGTAVCYTRSQVVRPRQANVVRSILDNGSVSTASAAAARWIRDKGVPVSSVVSEQPMPQSQVVDLSTVTPAELEGLWHHEEQWWREHLLWDISHPLEALRRVIGRRGVLGKAVRVGTQTVG